MHADAAMDMEKPFGAYGGDYLFIYLFLVCVSFSVCQSARLPPKMEIETVKM